MDFTLNKYTELLSALQENGRFANSFADYCENKSDEKCVILRHDVDLRPEMSLAVAEKEFIMGVKASYYFRAVPESWDENIIRKISDMGHEIGYHYESLTTTNGDIDAAWDNFRHNLDRLRKLADVKTICMHGSPRSKFDSKDLWNKYDYRTLGIVGEPYIDTDWNNVFYLTDTGRRWDGYKVSVRDKIPVWQEVWVRNGWSFHSTDDVVHGLNTLKLPGQIMITTHPQRWYNSTYGWTKEFVLQNMKNIIKRYLIDS